jgi:hypothetical protein
MVAHSPSLWLRYRPGYRGRSTNVAGSGLYNVAMSEASSVIDGIRKAIQDLVAPELGAIKAEGAATTRSLGELRTEIVNMENRLMRYFDSRIDDLRDTICLRERVSALEAQVTSEKTQ